MVTAKTPLLPAAAERRYVSDLRRVWRVIGQTIAIGIRPLLEVWPAGETTDSLDEDLWARAYTRAYVRADRRGGPPVGPSKGLMSPPPINKPMDLMSDLEVQTLWPDLNVEEIREFAPWATSYSQVIRLAYPPGENPNQFDAQERVRAAIMAEQAARLTRGPLPPAVGTATRRAPGAFRLRRVPESLRPFIYGRSGNPLVPPRPTMINHAIIQAQMGWVEMAVEESLTVEQLDPVIMRAADGVERVVDRELSRVVPIDARNTSGARAMINSWREVNIGLIESGVAGRQMSPRLRPSLLADVSRTVEAAHASGLRVEVLAGELQRRFEVGDSRAELIARDQTLKLNAQIHRQKQQAAGIREYIWRSSKDSRVRPEHRRLHDTKQSWDNPPSVGGGRHEHPGGDFQCRCRARPVLD